MDYFEAPDWPVMLDITSLARPKHSIFLAGSIEMDSAQEWQKDFVDSFEDVDCIVCNPRRKDWDNKITQSLDDDAFFEQVNWELDALDAVDIIVMNFDKDTISPITLLELGLYAPTQKLIVHCPDGFHRKGNVDIVCERYGVQTVNSFEELIEQTKIELEAL